MRPEAKKIVDELHNDLATHLHSLGSWDNYDRETHAALRQRALEVANFDVAESSMFLAQLESAIGNFDEFRRWVRNLENNNRANEARRMEFLHFINNGFATKGQQLLKHIYENRGDLLLMEVAIGAVALGAFNSIYEVIEGAESRQEVIAMTKFINTIRSSHKVINELGLTDSDIGSVFDIAGEVLREHHLSWASNHIRVASACEKMGGPSIAIDWPIFVSPSDAAKLTWDLTGRVIDRELDRKGLCVGFIGFDIK